MMIISSLPIDGAYLIEAEPIKDERGSFARVFCQKELGELAFTIKQCNISHNTKKGTFRGMHYQKYPYPEIKIVSCPKGKIYDIMVDLRKDSPTYKQSFGIKLSGDCYIYIPPMVAHGFQTLEDNTSVYYQLGEFFEPSAYEGVRYNDVQFDITLPLEISEISEKDATYKDFQS